MATKSGLSIRVRALFSVNGAKKRSTYIHITPARAATAATALHRGAELLLLILSTHFFTFLFIVQEWWELRNKQTYLPPLSPLLSLSNKQKNKKQKTNKTYV